MRSTWLIGLLLIISVSVSAAPLKIASWNIQHLRDKNNEGPNPRKTADYHRLKKYADQLNADVVGLQEVEGVAAAKRIFDPNHYQLLFSRRNHPQPFWPEIDDGQPAAADLLRPTESKRNPCWDGEYAQFIDHFALGQTLGPWLVPNSFEVLEYTEDRNLKIKLSDHCPISIVLDVSDQVPVGTKVKLLRRAQNVERAMRALKQDVEAMP